MNVFCGAQESASFSNIRKTVEKKVRSLFNIQTTTAEWV